MTSESTPNNPKTVLITGCSAGGIGSALAETFTERGLHVFATARTLSKMAHLEKRPNITLLELDVTSASSIHAAVETVMAITGGKLEYLVNNSGQSCVRPALDTDLERAKKLFDVNFWGAVDMIHAFAPLVIASRGTIVNVGTIASVLNVPWGCKFQVHNDASHTEFAKLQVYGIYTYTVQS
jgi:NADP-dependent 3-hydroxy acid dehydrogenase YdfG